MENNKLWCVSFNEFEKMAKKHGWDKYIPSDIAIISINNSIHCGVEDEYHICSDSDNVLNLDFDDIDPSALGLSDDTETYTFENKYRPGTYTTVDFFNSIMAKKSVEFIEYNKNKNFYIHCSAGISRSQAFVKYINNTYFDTGWETNPNNPCKFPNGFVYSKLMEANRNYYTSNIL